MYSAKRITSKHTLSITCDRQTTTLHEMRYLDLFWQTNKTLYRSTLATSTRRTEFQLPFNPLKPSDYYTYVPSRLTVKNSTFCK